MNLIEQLNISDFKLDGNQFSVQMNLTDFHAQPLGFLNGGATLAFAEISAGMASNQLSPDFFAVGQSITANHLNPKKAQGFVQAQGILLRQGKRNHIWEIKIFDEDHETLISQITVTNALIEKNAQ